MDIGDIKGVYGVMGPINDFLGTLTLKCMSQG